MAFVYVLQDKNTGKHYTGSCLELSKRTQRHKSHTGGRTTSRGEWSLLCSKEFSSIEEVRKVEKFLKSYKGGNGFRKVIEEWRRG
ncbi:MAG: GIY-YIG nuclease family protein [Candidatus Pacebacteria bacterium]|nr:GIY-YIG nuclease family protein [Candidatus Paceibacterota bacterium]